MKLEKSFRARPAAEQQRALLLHRICSGIAARIALGASLKKAIRQAVNRAGRGEFKLGGNRKLKFSRQSLLRYFYDWLKKPSPKTFLHRYKPGKAMIPERLGREFLRRCVRNKSAAESYESLRADWKAGKWIPGVSSWRTWVLKNAPHLAHSPTPPAFPYSIRTFHRRFTRRDAKQLRTLRGKVRSTQTALASFERDLIARNQQQYGGQP
jgi:hypothetical protein